MRSPRREVLMARFSKTFLTQPLDRLALGILAGLMMAIVLLLITGEHSSPKVRSFSWQDQTISAKDTAFTLSFSRPMEPDSIAENLKITPELPGKMSWAGRRMAYTLTRPAEYGQTYRIELPSGKERLNKQANPLQAFSAQVSSRDRIFAYVGTEGDEVGRLVLFNLTKSEKRVLTPSSLEVMDFHPYALRDRILFSAVERSNQPKGIAEQQIYSVTTGLLANQTSGQIEKVLDNTTYQNLKFDLSDDGETIVVQRVKRNQSNEFGPWILQAGQEPKSLKTQQPGGDFVITPDGTAMAIAQGQGLAILPLQPEASPLSFLPQFGTVLGFAKDGNSAAMLKFNTDYTRSLYLVNNQGLQKELLRTTGSIRSAQFSPRSNNLYCLLTQLQSGGVYKETPYIAVVDLQEAMGLEKAPTAITPLLELPEQRDIQMSLAPDGRAILFDQLNPSNAPTGQASQSGSRLWLLPLSPDPKVRLQPTALPLPGFHPRWLP
jgi:hypothetical protein